MWTIVSISNVTFNYDIFSTSGHFKTPLKSTPSSLFYQNVNVDHRSTSIHPFKISRSLTVNANEPPVNPFTNMYSVFFHTFWMVGGAASSPSCSTTTFAGRERKSSPSSMSRYGTEDRRVITVIGRNRSYQFLHVITRVGYTEDPLRVVSMHYVSGFNVR